MGLFPLAPKIMPGVGPQEIEEQNVETVTVAEGSISVLVYHPYDGMVKWFCDELGQIWVKLRETTDDGKYQTKVFPGHLVLEVSYIPRTPS